ncbi:hypothetical protein [Allosphingosinicella indica]|uniref:Uncharacterized protein n=1 Tax=Allosphingosinicella indica TaxID=941907 RepID=A0A1X7FZR0_9SPHN|nr:hypothetical protein [Allosphingosinicella indica]SMF61610.1 hypothetical protein SAMN06295910_0602 [Allosphingosinicella indica]
MKTAAFAIALMMGTAAIAQTHDATHGDMNTPMEATTTDTTVDSTTTADWSATTTAPAPMAAASGATVEAHNASPERDARGIAVISDAANVPAGWNGVTGSAEGGPLLDATGAPVAPDNYPACSRTITDNCLQAYERGRQG